MKFTTKALLLANAASVVVAFAPPRPHSLTTQTTHQFQQQSRFPQQQTQQQTTSSALPLFPDPSTLESSSTLLTSDLIDSLVNTVGSLALLGSVGFGVFTGMKDEDWEYEYKAGNEEAKLKYGSNADLALIGVSPEEVAEDMLKGQVTEAQKSFFGKEDEPTAAAAAPQKTTPGATPAQKSFFGKVKAAAAPAPKEPKRMIPVVTAQPAKASNPSDTVLKATEVAKSEVQKKGVQETKQKMSSKSASAATTSTPPPPAASETKTEEVKSKVTEVKKEKGTTRKLAKGATLIVAAGAVAVARNVVKAWLGRGML
ncbi:hypothetical protein QTG54_005633 [Skeletonema marinoi]|uniref:Uncharacterized protein n=1 Tax=Skeletonema marinoi TaxID=267567 RepID=A0AAD8YCR4_9STRA|nr:hypothetical protein QTG54_005633 [Skeletonema marinoi]